MTRKKNKRPSPASRSPRPAGAGSERRTTTGAGSRSHKPSAGSASPTRAIPPWIGPVALAGLAIAALLIFFVSRVANQPGATGVPGSTPAANPTAAEPTATAVEPATPATVQRHFDTPPPLVIDTSKSYTATIETAKGNIVVALNPKAAPQTVNNFVFLARNGFYNGLTFHRVEPGFVVQGGDPNGDGSGGPGYTLPAEIELPHPEGAVAMARLPDEVNPDRESSGSQFYITLAPTPHLDGAYTVFGQVTEGMDVVRLLVRGDVIESVTIQEQ